MSAPVLTDISAGSAKARSGLFWLQGYRQDANGQQQALSGVQLEVATNRRFRNPRVIQNLITEAANDYTLKRVVRGLEPNTSYFYRFGADGAYSPVGRFQTAPLADSRVAVRFGFSGCADDRYRPFSSIADIASQRLDFFVMLGDAIYSAASTNSPAAIAPYPDNKISTSLAGYQRKYRESRNPDFGNLAELYRSQGLYAAFDNHEMADGPYETGGADPQILVGYDKNMEGTDNPQLFVNKGSSFVNRTPGYQALTKAWSDAMPERDRGRIQNPADPRSDGSRRFYYRQNWGRNLTFFNVDDRSYRDAKLTTTPSPDTKSEDITGSDADTPGRRILGQTQLAWLKRSLRQAQQDGVTWKVVSISSPIDITGLPGNVGNVEQGGTLNVDAKQWWGNYREERNNLLSFIARKQIRNVLFIATDDHEFRANELSYSPSGNYADPITYMPVPGALSLVTSPIGAGRPSTFADSSQVPSLATLAQQYNDNFIASGLNPTGLEQGLFPLKSFNRQQVSGYSSNPDQPGLLDFWSPESFNYTTIAISRSGDLSVSVRGIPGYGSESQIGSAPLGADAVLPYIDFTIAPVS